MPVAIVAGAEDRLVDPEAQSASLHREIPHTSFDRVRGAGHMVHQTATAAAWAAREKSVFPAIWTMASGWMSASDVVTVVERRDLH